MSIDFAKGAIYLIMNVYVGFNASLMIFPDSLMLMRTPLDSVQDRLLPANVSIQAKLGEKIGWAAKMRDKYSERWGGNCVISCYLISNYQNILTSGNEMNLSSSNFTNSAKYLIKMKIKSIFYKLPTNKICGDMRKYLTLTPFWWSPGYKALGFLRFAKTLTNAGLL